MFSTCCTIRDGLTELRNWRRPVSIFVPLPHLFFSCLSWFKPDTVVINNHEIHETHERNRQGSRTSLDSVMPGQLLQLHATLWL